MPMEMLDAVDRRLLRALQEDGRLSNAELARRCNLSAAACFERVRRLRARRVITGYAALIDPAKVGRGLLIFVEVLLDRTTGDMFEAFAEAVRRQPEVLECHMVAGGFDYLIKARVGDMGVFVDVLDPARIKTGRPALDPVDPVALAQEEARQVGPVLAGDAGNQGCLLLAHGPRSRLAPPL
jgi:Lrp/AsnC family leucine-responsive transcriptional regulator